MRGGSFATAARGAAAPLLRCAPPIASVEHLSDVSVLLSGADAVMDATSSVLDQLRNVGASLGFNPSGDELTGELRDELDVGVQLRQVSAGDTTLVLDSLGRDLVLFLAASVVVTPASRFLNVTPILLYLIMGALLGPSGGLNVFSNSAADVELGDFGILFLLFSEGLEISREKLKCLAQYLPLGLAQLSLTSGVLSAAILLGAPQFLERFLPLDDGLINVQNPAEAFILAVAGTLSTSAFVFPVLKEKGWEERGAGQAATSILLLQDLMVAPLLVLLPFIVGQGVTDPAAVTFLTFKATFGFGIAVAIGSVVLRRVFELVAQARSTETFVALCLLVATASGSIAKDLGLTDTAGAFAAGVLLANTNYRAQIQADILPFKGILLGIFFMDAGSSFDLALVASEWPTVLAGALSLVLLKAATILAATRVPRWMEPNRLAPVEGVRLSLLLAGGGEFAFVVLALAEKLGALPEDLGGLLTAIVLISMALTPLLGDLAEAASTPFNAAAAEDGLGGDAGDGDDLQQAELDSALEAESEGGAVANDAVVVCGFAEIGRDVARSLVRGAEASAKAEDGTGGAARSVAAMALPGIVAFDNDPLVVRRALDRGLPDGTAIRFGDGANAELLRASGVAEPRAIFITYDEHEQCLAAAARLRSGFGPDAPIFARAQSRQQAQALKAAGATEVVIEYEELPRSASALLYGLPSWPATASALGLNAAEVKSMLELYKSVDADADGTVCVEELRAMLTKSNSGLRSDGEIERLNRWLEDRSSQLGDRMSFFEFCRVWQDATRAVPADLVDS